MGPPTRLSRSFFDRHPLEVAPDLLGKLLVVPDAALRLNEVEAYCGSDDPGSHGYRGLTVRNSVMFGPPGYLYVYFTYGMHYCANVVTAPEGGAGAVLLRAGEPVWGQEAMHTRRGRRDLASGPAKLCQALGLGRAENGVDLGRADGPVYLADDGACAPSHEVTRRVGLAQGKGDDLLYRFVVSPAV